MIHDIKNNQLGITPHLLSSKSSPLPGDLPQNKLGGIYKATEASLWSWLIIVAIIVVIILIFVLAIWPAIKGWPVFGIFLFGLGYFGGLIAVLAVVV